MKVALINPNWNLHDIKFTTVSIKPPKSIPLELIYIAESIRDLTEVKILDAYANNYSLDTLINKLEDFNPHLTIIETAPTYLFWRCPPLDLSVPKKIVKQIKNNLETKVAIIGPHGTNDPSWTKRETGADMVIRGESDLIFRDIVSNKHGIKGVYITNENGIASVDMESLPFPAFDLLDLEKYEAHAWLPEIKKHLIKDSKSNFTLEFSRGCIFNCVYCFKDGFRDKFRSKNLSQTARELDYVVEKGGKYIYFIDELFNKPSERLYSLLDQLKERNLSFGNQSRPDIMTKKLIKKMAESGCIYIEYGLESENQRIASSIGKNINQSKVKRIVEITKNYIPTVNLFHINFYSPDYAEILGLEQKPIEEWDSKPIRPYPGTYLSEKIFEKYNVKENKWEFALRYTWWLGVEYQLRMNNKLSDINSIKECILFDNYEKSKNITYQILGKPKKK